MLKALKKIRAYLNRGTRASDSGFAKLNFFSVTIATVALILLSAFMISQVISAIQLSSTISNVGTLKLSADMGLYWDSGFTNAVTALNWESMLPGTTKSYSIYIRNEGSLPLTLSMSTSNWSPSSASNYLNLNWKYVDGQTIGAGKSGQVTLTLAVSRSVTGISSFNFDLTAEGSV